jgi:DUF2971 family protein
VSEAAMHHIIDSENEMDSGVQNTVPEILYHYTTQVGFLGIIQSKNIWATDIRYLNDKREYLVAMELLSERVQTFLDRWLPGSPQSLFLQKLQARLTNIWEWTFFAGCFSEDGDLLSQWRGYGQGGGYALGFRGEILANQLRTQNWTLASCVYDPDQQVALIDQLLDASIARLKDPDSVPIVEEAPPRPQPRSGDPFESSFDAKALFPLPRTTPEWMVDAFHELTSSFALSGPKIKNEAFKEEREWRAISSNWTYGLVRVRAGLGVLRPYIPLDVPLSLAELVVGPSSHQDLARQAAKVALDQHEVYCETVRLSKVPYRDW